MKQIKYKNEKFVIWKIEINLEETLYPVLENKEIYVNISHIYNKIEIQ